MKPITLSKSRFAIALDCPRQLDYARDPLYYDARSENEFLASLAEGGHQVGELARQMYPGGILVSDQSTDAQVARTAELLARDEVVIFEATIRHQNLLIRADVLQKKGNRVSLYEVKASGFDPNTERFRTVKGTHPVRSEWRSYLYDVAFQTYVLRLARTDFEVTPHLMLLDKTVRVKVAGLNPMLAVHAAGRQVTVTVDPVFDIDKISPSILSPVSVEAEVALLLEHPLEVLGLPKSFQEFVDWASGILGSGGSFPIDVGPQCKGCPFYVDPSVVAADRKSGWATCMEAHFGGKSPPRRAETVFGLYRASGKAVGTLLAGGELALATLPESALGEVEASRQEILLEQRRLLQVAEAHGDVTAPVVLTGALRRTMAQWRWPLHFIDFETSRPALPYHRGRTPYDQILFQFSHHVLTEGGFLEHRTQCLEASLGVAPSVPVLRALRDALAGDDGTVLHWWTHEDMVLREIREQIQLDPTADADTLVAFVDSLVGGGQRAGRLQDLGKLVSKTVFYPGTAGSSSIKKVLPAALRYSKARRDRYGAPVYGTNAMPSLNFKDWVWVREKEGAIQDPYSLLDPVILNPVLRGAVAAAEDDDSGESASFINNGGAAIIAFDQLQQPDLSTDERSRIRLELLRYCELDTLAMVMVYQSLTGDEV